MHSVRGAPTIMHSLFLPLLAAQLIGVINGCFGAAFNLCINQLNTWK